MGFFDQLGRAAQSAWNDAGNVAETVVKEAENVAGWAADRAADVTNWFGDLFAGNLGTQAVEASVMVQAVLASRGAPSWHEGAQIADELANRHHDIGNRIGQIGSGLQAVWTGRGADAAQTKLRPLADVVDAAARTFTANASNLNGMAHGFDHLKGSLVPMPAKPHKNFGDIVTPWDTDTERQIDNYNRIAQENLDRYSAYAQQARAGRQQLKIDYGQLGDFGNGEFAIGQTAGPGKPPARRGVGSPRGTAGEAPGRSQGDQGTGTSTSREPDTRPGVSGPGAVVPAEHTRPAAVSSPLSGEVLAQTTGGSPSNAISLPPGSSADPGQVNGRIGAGGSLAVGPGRGVGAARPGESAGRAAGMGVKGAAGGRGVPGAGGVAAGPVGARGAEDHEHERRYGVVDDSMFGLDVHGDRVLDPTTGMPVTPPTIGG
ncbi:hypothetical protein AB5J62_15050 [Amycolatopsis sp. cg5]|uniref:hypothetical protein n=1 Tax=Amycolatopsis sp. cg5 TaxID=3238802 RepID=UPI003523662A